MTVKELSEKTGKSQAAIYNLARKLGRLPTEKEILSQKSGRPQKYK
mgnify:CR=1 FL=1